MQKLFSDMSNLQTHFHFKFALKKNNTQEAISCKEDTFPAEYASGESKHDIKAKCNCGVMCDFKLHIWLL